MLSFVNLPLKIIGLLEGNVSSREIAAGVCLGMFLGFTPLNGPMAFLLVLFFFIFKVNRVSTLITLPLFKAVYLLGLSGLLEKFGGYLLIDARFLSGFWAWITGLPVIAYLDLNNTYVAGGLVGSALLAVPLYFTAERLSGILKNAYAERLKNSKIAKAVSGLKLAGKVQAVVNTDSGVSLNVKSIRQMVIGKVKQRIFKPKAEATGLAKRVNLRGLAIVVAGLIIIQVGAGLVISPIFGSLIIDTMNRSAGTKILAEKINIWPLTLSFSIKGLKVFDPDNPDERIVKADSASFSVSPMAILSKRLVFSSINLNGVDLDLIGARDGSFNIQNLSRSISASGGPVSAQAGKRDMGSVWKFASDNKGTAGKLYDFIKNKYSKKGQEEIKAKRSASKQAKAVTELPKGRSVRFRSGSGAYIFEIRKLSLNNGRVRIRPYGQKEVEIDNANLSLGHLAFDPENGTALGLLSLRGDIARGDGKRGGMKIDISQSEKDARFEIDLKGIDVNTVRFAYQDALPVDMVKGYIDLSSKTSIKGEALDSRTSLKLTDQQIAAKDGSKVVFGFIPMSVLVDALNGVSPLDLRFSIGGTVEKPELKGLQESLMVIVKPYLANIQDRLVKDGVKGAVDQFKSLLKSKFE